MIMFYPTSKVFDYHAHDDADGIVGVFLHQINERYGVMICANDEPTVESLDDLPELTLSSSHDDDETQGIEELLPYVRVEASIYNPDGGKFLRNYRDIFQRKLTDECKSWVLKGVGITSDGITLQYDDGLTMCLQLLKGNELALKVPAYGNHEAQKIVIRRLDENKFGASQTYAIDVDNDSVSMTIDFFDAGMNNSDKPTANVMCSYPAEIAEQIFQDYHLRNTSTSRDDSDGRVFYCY